MNNDKNKRKRWLIPLVIIGVVAVILIWGQVAAKLDASKPKMIFFYGDTCPHCKNVEDYMAQNNIRARLSFQELEVYNNSKNAQLLAQTAQKCGLDTSQGIGVPLFYDGQTCILGDQDIINYLKTK